LRLTILNPVAELEVQHTVEMPGADKKVVFARYRCAGVIHDRPAYKRVDSKADTEQRLFWMESQRGAALPRLGRWMLVNLAEDGSGVDSMVARSHPDDGSSWASLWPWCAEKGGWERLIVNYGKGVQLIEAEFLPDPPMLVKMVSPSISFAGIDGIPYNMSGKFHTLGMCNGRCYYVQRQENAMAGANPLALWYAEDRGQWVISGTDRLGDSTQVIARISSRAWWPWEAHLTSNSSPALMGAAMLAAMPEWHHGAAMLSALRTSWEVSHPSGDKFHPVKDMAVEMLHEKQLTITAGEGALHPFLGDYVYAGLLSHRPYFLQQRKNERKKARFAVWYAEDDEGWVITNDYRLLDGTTVDSKAEDSAWFPWEVDCGWQIADGQGGFVVDILLKVNVSHATLLGRNGKKKSTMKVGGSEVSATSGSEPDC
jgi:hypothetical protein